MASDPMTFQQWLVALDAEGTRRGYVGKNPLSSCGEECWREAFEEGRSPADALDEDESNGE